MELHKHLPLVFYAAAVDYDKMAKATKRFYATVQNKTHSAVHGHTAAERIAERADAEKEHMGLTTWADAPKGKIKKTDIAVTKNYLFEFETGQLDRPVSAILILLKAWHVGIFRLQCRIGKQG